MAKTLSSVTLTAPAGAINANAGDTFTFTATPGFSGTSAVNRYDLKFEVNNGGGFVATVPDLPGCMSDGETPEEAMHNVMDAIEEWIDASRTLGRDVPAPSRQAQTG